jgi:DnaJ-class molecular chaperone
MAGSFLKRIFLRHEGEAGNPTVPCPGCGGRGRFEWSRDETLPRQWSRDAPCGMCGGRGVVPDSWLRDTPTARAA